MDLRSYFLSLFDQISKTVHESVSGLPQKTLQLAYEETTESQPFQGPVGHIEALHPMPLPMKTLLLGLHDVKVNQVQDKFAHDCNTQNHFMHTLDIYVKTLLQCYEALSSEMKALSEKLSEVFQTEFPKATYKDLQQAFQEQGLSFLDLNDSNVSLVNMYQWYLQNRKHIDEELYQETVQRLLKNTKPTQVFHANGRTIASTQRAVSESQKIRKRLEDLTKGPISSLMTFEEPQEQSDEPEIHMNMQSLETAPTPREGRLVHLQAKLVDFYWTLVDLDARTNMAKRMHVRDLCVLYQKTFQVLAMECKRGLDRKDTLYECPLDLAKADKSLQQEIRLLYNTITINQDDLNSYLAHIRYEVYKTRSHNQKELDRRLHSYVQGLSIRIQEALFKMTKTFEEVYAM
jgi:hypothetical protein